MDVVSDLCISKDFGNFDMNMLASTLTNTDMLITKIKEQTLENANLKSKLQSLNESAIQIRNVYTMEKEKSLKIESENRSMQEHLKELEEKLQTLENKIVNDSSIHAQTVAEIEHRLGDQSQYTNLCKMFIIQGNLLIENNLSNNSLLRQYNIAKEYLSKRGEYVEDCKRPPKKKISKSTNASTMTDDVQTKTYSNKATMHCPSTATRGTTTMALTKTCTVGTNFPEPMSVEQIFRETIVDIPELIPEIDDFKWPTEECSTQTQKRATRNIGTITAIKNVRQKINYGRKIRQNLLKNPDSLLGIKKEEHSPMGSMNDLAERNDTLLSMVNPQLSELWKILGQTIFTIVGNGRIFNDSSNLSLINENIDRIKTVLMEHNGYNQSIPSTSIVKVKSSNSVKDDSLDGFESFSTVQNVMDEKDLHELLNESDLQYVEDENIGVASIFNLEPADMCTAKIDIDDNQSSINVCEQEAVKDFSKDSFSVAENLNINKLSNLPVLCELPSDNLTNDTALSGKVIFDSVESDININKTSSQVMERYSENVFKIPSSTVPRIIKKKSPLNASVIKRKTRRHRHRNKSNIGNIPIKFISSNDQTEHNNINTDTTLCIENSNESDCCSFDDLEKFDIKSILSYFQVPDLIEPIPNLIEDFSITQESISEKSCSFVDSFQIHIQSNECQSDKVDCIEQLPLLSPASPSPEDRGDNEEETKTKQILFNPKSKSLSLIKSMIENYDLNIYSKTISMANTNQLIESKLIGKLRKLCEIYLISEWTSVNLKICFIKLLKLSTEPKLLATTFLELIEDTDESLDTTYTPPAPSLPKTHQKLLVLIENISEYLPGFKEYCLQSIEKRLFILKENLMPLQVLMNLTHFYIGLIDTVETWKSNIRLFVYKCLYYMNYKALPMIYACLMAYPEVLPKIVKNIKDGPVTVDDLLNQDSLVLAIQTVLMNINLNDNSKPEFKKKELLYIFRSYYSYVRISFDDAVKNIINNLRFGNTKNISYALILLGKKSESNWARKNIIDQHLIPLLKEYLSDLNETCEHDKKVKLILTTISCIVKTQPVKADITSYHQLFLTVLNATDRQSIQESAIEALLRTSRFGIVNVYQAISEWSPSFHINNRLYCMLNSFIYRMKPNFWEQI